MDVQITTKTVNLRDLEPNAYTYNWLCANWCSLSEFNENYEQKIRAVDTFTATSEVVNSYTNGNYCDMVFITTWDRSCISTTPSFNRTTIDVVDDMPLKDIYLDISFEGPDGSIATSAMYCNFTWRSREDDSEVRFIEGGQLINPPVPYMRVYNDVISDDVVLIPLSIFSPTNNGVRQIFAHNTSTGTFYHENAAYFYEPYSNQSLALMPVTEHTATLNTSPYGVAEGWWTDQHRYTYEPEDVLLRERIYFPDRWGNTISSYGLTDEAIKRIVACTGMYFKYDDEMYLGYMDESGQTTGEYLTADEWEKSAQYDKDTIKNFTEHKDPIGPEPAPDEDDIDDMGFNAGSSYGGFIKYYQMGAVQMGQFGAELSNEDLIKSGFDPFKSIISLKKYHKPLWHFGNFSSQLEKIKVSYQEFNTEAQRLISSKGYLEIGNIVVNGKYGTKEKPHFLDLEPYTTAELFIPYCGFLPLPVTKIMYNNITVTLVYDLRTGSCQAVVKCNGEYIATKAGTLCEDIPITGEAVGLEKASVMNGVIGAISGGVQAASSVLAGVIGQKVNPKSNSIGSSIPSAANGVMTAISSITQAVVAANRNYTEVIGSASGETIFNMASKCYLKLTQPIAYVPEFYNEMFGRPLNKTVSLSEMKGLCVCEHVHINFPCTKTEEDLLVTALESGFYMPHRDL